jgi:bacteriocin biosynthesis cyclodehydratase domain-containing protein
MPTKTALSHPRLKPWLRVAADDEGVVVEFAQRVIRFDGRAATSLLPALLPLLDGTRTVEDVAHELGEVIRPAIDNALAILAEHDLLVDGPSFGAGLPDPVASSAELLASTSALHRQIDDVRGILSEATVAVVGAGHVADEVLRTLALSGVGSLARSDRLGDPTLDVSLAIVAPSPPELPRLADWNEQALATGDPWLQILPYDGRYAAIGPLFLPGESCCHECFQRRRAANLEFREEFWKLASAPAAYPSSPALDAALAGIAATVALRWLVDRDQFLPGAFYALEYASSMDGPVAVSNHFVHRVPRCAACSSISGIAPPLPWFKELADERG